MTAATTNLQAGTLAHYRHPHLILIHHRGLLTTLITVLATIMHSLLYRLTAIVSTSAMPFTPSTRQQTFCGTGTPSQSFINQARLFSQANDSTTPPVNAITVDLYLHFIVEREEQRPSNKSIQAQITRLQTSYAPSNILFNHINTSFTIDSYAANPYLDLWTGTVIPSYEKTMPQLRCGNYSDLNIFYFSGLAYVNDGLYGRSRFPNVFRENTTSSSVLDQDGPIIDLSTLPGYDLSLLDASQEFNLTLGIVTVHEVGHWFGLHHVFDDHSYAPACDDNDYIVDTPVQKTMSLGCPVGKDSCPHKSGMDNVHNYMDYSDDTCKTTFTPGQSKRMHQNYDLYRRAKTSPSATNSSSIRSDNSSMIVTSPASTPLLKRDWPYSPSQSQLDSPRPLAIGSGNLISSNRKRQIDDKSYTIGVGTHGTVDTDPAVRPATDDEVQVRAHLPSVNLMEHVARAPTRQGRDPWSKVHVMALRSTTSFTRRTTTKSSKPTSTSNSTSSVDNGGGDNKKIFVPITTAAGAANILERDAEASRTTSPSASTKRSTSTSMRSTSTSTDNGGGDNFNAVGRDFAGVGITTTSTMKRTSSMSSTSTTRRSTTTTSSTSSDFGGGDNKKVLVPVTAPAVALIERDDAGVGLTTTTTSSSKRTTSTTTLTTKRSTSTSMSSSTSSDNGGGDNLKVVVSPITTDAVFLAPRDGFSMEATTLVTSRRATRSLKVGGTSTSRSSGGGDE